MHYGERFNSISHLVGAVFALMGWGALLTVAIQHQDVWMIISFSIYGFLLALLYTISTLYHSFHPPELKRIFQKLDHISIYLLIAGTYTPFTLVTMRESSGPTILAVVWALALIGILIDTLHPRRIEFLQVSIYVIMGWLGIMEYENLKLYLPWPGVMWLIAGGVAYTFGIIFYILDHMGKLTHAHGIWHLFVLTGSVCHFISVIGYVR